MTTATIELTDEFTRALALLQDGRHLFLTGKAGAGKSTLIRHFIATTDRAVLVAAPTGIAALNVDGYTIHRLFGFHPTLTLEQVRDGRYFPGRFAAALKALDTLIIDEASMVRADLFDMLVAALERFGPKPQTPFGGVQLVLVGDLFQLPPVVQQGEQAHFQSRYATPYFFSADRFDPAQFPTVALTKVFRQLGDPRMTGILNAIREGTLLTRAREELNERTDPDFEPPQDEFWLTLAPTNRIVTARNRQQLDRLDGREHVHHARRTGDLELFDPPVEEQLRFKVGAQIMMLTNDPGERWVNGSIGRILQVTQTADDPVVTVELRDGSIADVRPHQWEATRPVVEGGRLRHEIIGTYTQLPFKLAWAITIHKSQGQTLDRLVVDLTGGTFAFGQVYVALSRCTSLGGLVLRRPVLAKDLKTDRRVARFLHEAVPEAHARRYCALGICLIGDEGRLSRPRPVEIAVAFDDGTAISTLVNPQRDLADARARYGIGVEDVLLAPTLAQAWSVLAPLVRDCTPVGVGTDDALGLLDFELKRLGSVADLPLGVEIPAASLTADERAELQAGHALDRAVAALRAHARIGPPDDGATAFGEFENEEGPTGLLLTRDPAVPTPSSSRTPTLAALLDVSRVISAVLLQADAAVNPDAAIHPAHSAGVARLIAAAQLRAAVTGTELTPGLAARLRDVERLLDAGTGAGILDAAAATPVAADPAAVLLPGARVCFTGEARLPDGRVLSRAEAEQLATAAGLVPVASVTRTRCDVLVVAERGTQSGKARKAREYGTPVLSTDEFLAWAAAPAAPTALSVPTAPQPVPRR